MLRLECIGENPLAWVDGVQPLNVLCELEVSYSTLDFLDLFCASSSSLLYLLLSFGGT